ncbi:MAG: alpha/beta fold hydrolase [Candidatus Yanofskybacteria bacterium]|nr:alpha/beta fold hydrolase [Candidatus Yanofskybacteria bacterium]
MELTTKDNKRIAADYYPAENPRGWVVYLHMMPATKESWRSLASYLAKNGYEGIAIDLRGHGASDGGPNGYEEFSDAEHQASIKDLEAGLKHLEGAGAVPKRIALIGASIGANLALGWLAEHEEYPCAVLLSAGSNYRGIETEPLARELRRGQRVLLVAARDDDRAGGNSAAQNEAIAAAMPEEAGKELLIYETGGHGTMLTEAHPELAEKILNFIAAS